jgi:hypothetical protein
VAFSRWKDTIANRLLDLQLGTSHDTTAFPATVYIALLTTAPTNANGAGLAEVTGGSYARVAVTNNDTNWPAATGRSKSNGTTVTFPTSTASWATVGNFLGYAALSSSQTVGSGVTPQFAIGAIVVSSPGT